MERDFQRITSTFTHAGSNALTLIPLFRFTLIESEENTQLRSQKFTTQRVKDFIARMESPLVRLECRQSNIDPDSLIAIDRRMAKELRSIAEPKWEQLFMRGVSQSLIKQYTNAVNTYSEAIQLNPANPFLYINRATTRAEMIDFISSIDNSYQSITLDSDPSKRLNSTSTRTYSYDEAIDDVNKAIKLYPEFAEAYFNRANVSVKLKDYKAAIVDYTTAISLNDRFPAAYYNRGLAKIYTGNTEGGVADLSKAGELGMYQAYSVIKRFR
jgi:tetratricopeptide (TPR) repeat protein